MHTPLLAIDTAAPRLQLALLIGDRTDTLVEDMAQGQAERLIPAIDELLARNAVTYADLRRIAVTTGPGSFTGLRIGLSAARGFGLALGISRWLACRRFWRCRSRPSAPSWRSCSMRGAMRPISRSSRVRAFPSGTPNCCRWPRRVARSRSAPTCSPRPLSTSPRSPDFAATVDPAAYPPDAAYIRDADAKPQEKFRVARVTPS